MDIIIIRQCMYTYTHIIIVYTHIGSYTCTYTYTLIPIHPLNL